MRDHPLWGWKGAVREIVCWFLGHRWKSSWHRNQRPFSDDYETGLSYRERHSGNPYYDFSAGWSYRCRRCRHATRNDSFHPWYKDYWYAFENGLRSLRFFWNERKDEEIESRVWYWIAAVNEGAFQFFAYMEDARHWPSFLWDWTGTWYHASMDKAYKWEYKEVKMEFRVASSTGLEQPPLKR